MRREIARIESLTLEPLGEPAIEIACPKAVIPGPGQAVLAIEPGSDRPHRIKLFPTRITREGFITDRPPEPGWLPGIALDLLGPIGRGFSPPSNTHRWLLLGVGIPPKRLWPLIDLGLERGIALSVWTDCARLPLPPDKHSRPRLSRPGWHPAPHAALTLTRVNPRRVGRQPAGSRAVHADHPPAPDRAPPLTLGRAPRP